MMRRVTWCGPSLIVGNSGSVLPVGSAAGVSDGSAAPMQAARLEACRKSRRVLRGLLATECESVGMGDSPGVVRVAGFFILKCGICDPVVISENVMRRYI